jgi:site-specific recombinase XerD
MSASQDLINRHLQDLRDQGYSETTVQIASSWLTKCASFFAERSLGELVTDDLVQWHKDLSWRPGPSGKLYSANTINQAVGALRRFYRLEISAGLLKSDPTVGLVTPSVKRTKSQKLSLLPSETRKLLSSLDFDTMDGIRNRAIIGMILETKISRRSCSDIDCSHLQLDTGALLTLGRVREIHSLSAGLLGDLERYLRDARPLLLGTESKPCEALFLNRNGGRFASASIQQMLTAQLKLCGLR